MEGKTIKERVAATGLKNKAIAEAIGMHPSTLAQTLNGTLPYSPEKNTAALDRFLGGIEPGAKIILENSKEKFAISG